MSKFYVKGLLNFWGQFLTCNVSREQGSDHHESLSDDNISGSVYEISHCLNFGRSVETQARCIPLVEEENGNSLDLI